jgi:hypothetical protein
VGGDLKENAEYHDAKDARSATDAELEQPGLFDAHNQRGRGGVVFVPFTKLQATP